MIGIFDSGVGGLGVLVEVRRLMPAADLIYLADHSHSPYGTRTLAEVQERCEQVAEWLIARHCQVITIACNTASAAALHPLREAHPGTAFVGMEPAIKPAAARSGTGRVGVVATAATFQGELFASVVARFATGVEVVTAACPSWVELVEQGTVAGPVAEREVTTCLLPLMEAGIDVLVLACTHYPALLPVIRSVVGPGVEIIDPAPAVARQTALVGTALSGGGGRLEVVSTANPAAVAAALDAFGIEAAPVLLPLP